MPTNASWMNRIEAQFQALRYFTLDGTDHRSHEEQNSMIRRYIIWRNRNAQDKTLRELVKRETLLDAALDRHGVIPSPTVRDPELPICRGSRGNIELCQGSRSVCDEDGV